MKKYSALFDGKSMRCTLESKRGDGGKMKNKKEGLFIQCIVCSLLPLITLFIPYLKFGISDKILFSGFVANYTIFVMNIGSIMLIVTF